MRVANLINLSWLNRTLPMVSWLVMVLAVCFVGYIGVNTVWTIVVGPSVTQTPPSPSTSTVSEPIDIEPILAANLFGRSVIETNQSTQTELLRETTLNLSLAGTFVDSKTDFDNRALISNREGSGITREYREGDAIAGFAKIESIQPRLVVISRSGERERLTFETSEFAIQSSISPLTSPITGGLRITPEDATILSSNEVDIDNLKQLGLAEVEVNGKPALAVTESDGTSYLGRFGMQPGDVVLSVNDIDVRQLRSDQARASEILSSGMARLVIIRNDREFVVTVPLP